MTVKGVWARSSNTVGYTLTLPVQNHIGYLFNYHQYLTVTDSQLTHGQVQLW